MVIVGCGGAIVGRGKIIMVNSSTRVLNVDSRCVTHFIRRNSAQRVPLHAIAGVDLHTMSGEISDLIGESGSEKTTLVRSLLDPHERNVQVVSDSMVFKSIECYDFEKKNHLLESMRGKNFVMVFQLLCASLSPSMTIWSKLREVLKRRSPEISREGVRSRVIRVLKEMGLNSERVRSSFPPQLSGGMCQRDSIAIAVIIQPELIVTDECTSALDVTSNTQVVNVLKKLTVSHQMAMLIVTHGILLVGELCRRLIVMQNGVIVEEGETAKVLAHPSHSYTRGLISAIPRWG